MECIILAGGLGTRLRGVIGDQPKCMAAVREKPFLEYLLKYLESEGCTRVVLSLGYRHEVILDWLQSNEWNFEVDHVIEQEPLGTGGGIQLALQKAKSDSVLVLNGDTMFRISLDELLNCHKAKGAETTLALKPMQEFERYGAVRIDDENRIVAFEEKKFQIEGLINGGIYCIDRERYLSRSLPEKHSFEKDYLEQYIDEKILYGFVADNYFIDIGVPEDYELAQITLPY